MRGTRFSSHLQAVTGATIRSLLLLHQHTRTNLVSKDQVHNLAEALSLDVILNTPILTSVAIWLLSEEYTACHASKKNIPVTLSELDGGNETRNWRISNQNSEELNRQKKVYGMEELL